MSFSNFEFIKTELPRVYNLAYITEEKIIKDPFEAMVNIQKMTRIILDIMAGDTGIVTNDFHVDGFLYTLYTRQIINDDMYALLREVELFCNDESEIVVDTSRIEAIFYKFYDFVVWYYQTYVNHDFIPRPFTSIGRKEKLEISNNDSDKEWVECFLNSDGEMKQKEWEKSLAMLNQYKVIEHPNDEKYCGQIHKGKKHGQGIYTWQDGTVYRGFWHNDLEYGYGEKIFANGDIYRGYWKDGVFNYKGMYKWKNGESYNGEWEDGYEHGYGVKTSTNGVKVRGLWTFGELVQRIDQIR